MQDRHLNIADMYILLVEPSPMQARLIQEQFSQLGIAGSTAVRSGEAALDRMRDDPPDLVISAMYLPDMSGADLITGMRMDPLLDDIPFMLISSETAFEALDPIRQAGAVGILPKPFSASDLKRALATSLDYINLFGEQDQRPEVDLASLRVLLVDDSAMARKHIRRVLAGLGIEQIDEGENGKAAIALLSMGYYDLVVTDYNMPEMDGRELVEYIRNQSTQASIPILMVTSEQNANSIAAVQQAGVSGICDKPFEPQQVEQFLQNLLSDY